MFSATNFFLLFLSINNIPRRKSSQFRTIQYLLTLRPLCPRHGWIFISRKRICIKLLTKAWNDDCSGVPDTYLKKLPRSNCFSHHTHRFCVMWFHGFFYYYYNVQCNYLHCNFRSLHPIKQNYFSTVYTFTQPNFLVFWNFIPKPNLEWHSFASNIEFNRLKAFQNTIF